MRKIILYFVVIFFTLTFKIPFLHCEENTMDCDKKILSRNGNILYGNGIAEIGVENLRINNDIKNVIFNVSKKNTSLNFAYIQIRTDDVIPNYTITLRDVDNIILKTYNFSGNSILNKDNLGFDNISNIYSIEVYFGDLIAGTTFSQLVSYGFYLQNNFPLDLHSISLNASLTCDFNNTARIKRLNTDFNIYPAKDVIKDTNFPVGYVLIIVTIIASYYTMNIFSNKNKYI